MKDELQDIEFSWAERLLVIVIVLTALALAAVCLHAQENKPAAPVQATPAATSAAQPSAGEKKPERVAQISDGLKLKLTTAQRDEARRVSRMQQLQLEFAALQQAAAQEAGRIAALVEQANQECGKDHVANPETLACDAKPAKQESVASSQESAKPKPTADAAEKKKP